MDEGTQNYFTLIQLDLVDYTLVFVAIRLTFTRSRGVIQ